MERIAIDLKENHLNRLNTDILSLLLKDHSSGRNIIWATDNYAQKGIGFQKGDTIEVSKVTGYNGNIIKPRITKSKKEQAERIRQKAEVFTPTWICNKQNNLVDSAWFGLNIVFNIENGKEWMETQDRIPFPTPSGKKWEDYIEDTCLEITCGEAPYLVSRYDAVTGEFIELPHRIGMLDRKLRVVAENTTTDTEWLKWVRIAFQNTYGFDWQGDNVLLARENLLLTYMDYYKARFGKEPSIDLLLEIAEILSWNIWQMDGLKFVIPESCIEADDGQLSFFVEKKHKPCPGCLKNDPFAHTGIYCRIKDWKANKTVKFVSLLKKGDAK